MPNKKKRLPLKQRVRVYLAEHSLTQSQLADRLGISPSHLSEILTGKESASLRVAVDLERITGIPARDFAEVA